MIDPGDFVLDFNCLSEIVSMECLLDSCVNKFIDVGEIGEVTLQLLNKTAQEHIRSSHA